MSQMITTRTARTHVTSHERVHEVARNNIRNHPPARFRIQHLARSRHPAGEEAFATRARAVPLIICARLSRSAPSGGVRALLCVSIGRERCRRRHVGKHVELALGVILE